MRHQKHLFQLQDDVHYLNGGYMSPLLKSVEEAGIKGILRKRNPYEINPSDFFSEAEEVRFKFSKIINCRQQQIAIIPGASYGLKAAVNNLPTNTGNSVIIVSDEFPSGYYAISKWCKDNSKDLLTIQVPDTFIKRGENWNGRILEAINFDTAAVIISSIHWKDGTKFNLKQIGERCKEVRAILIVDGTQSVGALPINVTDCKIDALICAGYKW
ncbi:MAG TPA: aminotransferase class V-fold PLP-dependent enzyme, partial [Segetibacter sp.]